MRLRTAALAIVLLAAAIPATAATKVAVASDGSGQLSIPTRWNEMELNENAEIQVGNGDDEAYVIVLNEAKVDMHGWNLERHSRVTLGSLLSNLDFPTVTGPKSLKIGGHPAVQYEVRGASDGTNIVYVHTTIDGAKFFSQILAWTLPSRADKVLPQLHDAVVSYREK